MGDEMKELPEWIPKDAWEGFVDMRKKLKKPLTERAERRMFNKLERMKAEGHDIEQVLNQSEDRCWTDVYPVAGVKAVVQTGPIDMSYTGFASRLKDTSWAD